MELAPDVVDWVSRNFPEDAREAALARLRSAVDHAGKPPEPRLQRCLAFSSHGDLALLEEQIRQLAIDFRDVIVAGEYGSQNGALVRLRDFSQPME